MKKNFLSLLTFALVLVNLALTAILAIAIVPETQKANELITKVADAIELDLQSADANAAQNLPVDQLDPFTFDEDFTVNLKAGEDGKQHMAIVGVLLRLNNKAENYSKLSEQLTNNKDVLRGRISSVLSSYTLEEFQSDEDAVKVALLQALQNEFGSDLIAEVVFTSTMFQ